MKNLGFNVSVGGQVERLKNVYYSEDGQKAILDFARNTLTELFAGKTLSELRSDADRLAFPLAERVNINLRHAGRIRGSMSAPGANLGRQIIDSVHGEVLVQISLRFDGDVYRV
jgi:hypothetical protein